MSDAGPRHSRAGLCGDCRSAERIESARGSVFYLCQRSFTDATFPKYPQLPVVACLGYEREMDPHDRPPARDQRRR